MATATDTDYESQSRELVEEFLRRDLLPSEAVQRVERLYVENRTTEALEVILAERRDRPSGEQQPPATQPRRR